MLVNVVTNYGGIPACERLISDLIEEFPDIATIVHSENGKKSNVATAEIENVLYGPGYIEEKLFDRRFQITASSFFQVNSLQTERLYRAAFELLQPTPSDRVLDLYCGSGSIGILLASRVGEVLGVELLSDGVRTARENARINDIQNIRFVQADAKDFLKTLQQNEPVFDTVVVDPPRAGLHPKALRRTIQLSVPKLLYISCNPATFARDAREICAAGYTATEIKPVDMFPHTRHIELVAMFHL